MKSGNLFGGAEAMIFELVMADLAKWFIDHETYGRVEESMQGYGGTIEQLYIY